MAGWYGGWEENYWACTEENLKFIDKKTGHIVNAVELRQLEEADLAEGERHWDVEEERRREEMGERQGTEL